MMRERRVRNLELFLYVADDQSLRVRRKQRPQNPQPRLRPQRRKHIRILRNLAFSNLAHISIIAEIWLQVNSFRPVLPLVWASHLKFLRSLTGTVLSIWLGFLACALGCVQPALAAEICPTPQQISRSSHFAIPVDDGANCCHHQRGSSNNSGSQHHTSMSCCPLDATVIQKQDLASISSVVLHVVLPALLVLDVPVRSSSTDTIVEPTLWQSGRDVLLQARV